MSSPPNPYAPPSADVFPPGGVPSASIAGRAYWREGNDLVVLKGARLPPRCVRTNEPTDFFLPRRLSWHPPWIFVFLVLGGLVGILLYAVIAAIFRKRADLDIPLSPAARARRRSGIITMSAGIGGGVLLAVVGFAVDQPLLAIAAIFAGLIALIVGAVLAPPVRVKKIDDHVIRLGVGEAFLASIPGYLG